MSKIDKNELYQHLSGFLKSKGLELKEGSYARRIEQGCGLLADAINASQRALKRTRAEMDKRVDRMRAIIHEKTAPRPPASAPDREPTPGRTKAPPKRGGPKRAAAGKARAGQRKRKR